MKQTWCLLALFLFTACLSAISVPFSDQPVLEESNLLSGFVRVDPDDKLPEKLITVAHVWQDGDFLKVNFTCAIDSNFAVGPIFTRDSSGSCDYVRVQLVTIPDAYFAYYYLASPSGGLEDGVRGTDMNVDYGWNSHYSYETKYSADSWTVTMSIPLAELRFEQKLPYQWKIILTRYYNESREYYSMPYANTSMRKDYFTNATNITLTHKVKRSIDFSLRPYFVKSYDLMEKTSSFDPDNLGLDISLNPSQRTRIKIALNPDYSDAPPDDASDNYNSKYPPYFSENRFFFTEDIDAFGLNTDIFYTRNIVKPHLAFKATGNSGIVNWGALGAFDRQITDEGTLINRDDYYQVLAVNPTWKTLSQTNALLSRVNQGYYNHVLRSSNKWEFLKNLFFRAEILGSIRKDETDTDPDAKYGYLANGTLTHSTKNWENSIYYTRVSRDFNEDMGYYPDNNLERAGASLTWTSDTKERFLRYYSLGFSGNYLNRHPDTGSLSEYSIGASAFVNTSIKMFWGLYPYLGMERDLAGDSHKYSSFSTSLNYYPIKELGGGLNIGRSKSLVYSLYDTYRRQNVSFSISSNLFNKVQALISCGVIDWDYPKVNTVILDGDTLTVVLDNSYLVGNGYVSLTPNQKVRVKVGYGISTYESDGILANLSYYANLRFEFLPEYFLYMGLSGSQIQDQDFSWADPTGHFLKTGTTAYVKISLTL